MGVSMLGFPVWAINACVGLVAIGLAYYLVDGMFLIIGILNLVIAIYEVSILKLNHKGGTNDLHNL